MKTLWTALSILAVANVLAVAGLVGWLVSSDRLDVDRARAIRGMFATTLAEDRAAAARAAKEAEAAAAAQEAERRASQPPLSAQERLDARLEATELDRQRALRLRREIEDLQAQLDRQRGELDTARADLARREKAFADALARQREATESEQFQRALSVLAALKPQEATALLMQLIQAPNASANPAFAPATPPSPGANGVAEIPADATAPLPSLTGASGMDTAIQYLNAMDDRPRARIMTEIAKADPALAAGLLERIRALGQFAQVPGEQP
jgi:hypothetical protein